MSTLSKEDQAIEMMAPRKFHRLFTAPATDKRGLLKVTYSIGGVDVDEKGADDVPTILWVGPMFATRYQAVFLNWIAETEGVRMVFIDRFVKRTLLIHHFHIPLSCMFPFKICRIEIVR